MRGLSASVILCAACASGTRAPEQARAPEQRTLPGQTVPDRVLRPPPAASTAGGARATPPRNDARATEPSAASTASPPEKPSFPPEDFPPPSVKSAQAGDGHWASSGDASLGERAAAEPRAIVRTVVHPHSESRFITVTIAAIDLQRLSLALIPGTEDLAWAKLPADDSSGLVPERDRAALVAVTNGGFQPKHGRWGLMANGVVVSPARKEGCTIALYSDGSVRIGPWSSLEDGAGKMQSYRQTPPCLVDGGVVHPALRKGLDKTWAGHAADLTTRRRSAMGIDSAGKVLFYAIGEEASPRWIAEALLAAGASVAAELDINWYWTRFLLFGTGGGLLQVTSTLIPKMEHLRTEYVERPSSRDFFYLFQRRQ